MKLNLHTIILMVGPSGSGKDHFIDNTLVPGLRACQSGFPFNIQHLSSDAIRREILGEDMYHKHEDRMVHVSEQAFKLLEAKLRLVTEYPVNAHFVIVNSTGLDKEFRSRILAIADENQYNVVCVMFDYNRREYFEYILDDPRAIRITKGHLEHFKKNVLSEISRKQFADVFRIRSRAEMATIKVEVPDLEEYKSRMLDPAQDYFIVGDIHGCLDELKALLEKIEWQKENRKTILIGDLVDKGPDSGGVLRFVKEHRDRFIIVRGNHENYVYRRFKDQMENTAGEIFERDNFTCMFELNEEEKLILYELFEGAKEFFVHPDFIVTHVPCKRKHLGKLIEHSRREQMRQSYPKHESNQTSDEYQESLEKFLGHLKTESQDRQPLHIFGHIAFPAVVRQKNKIGADTGAVYGNKLSAIHVRPGGKIDIHSVQAAREYRAGELVEIFAGGDKIDLDTLEPAVLARIDHAVKDKLNFVSGTMAPADKDETELESMAKALEYYREAGIKQIVLQPKAMGSRAQIILEKVIDIAPNV